MTLFQPDDAQAVQEVVAWAAAERQGLAISAGGSKGAFGRPSTAEHSLDLRRISGIVDYDPSELVLTARAATPLDEIVRELDAHDQTLAFEPPDWSELLPSDGVPTLGGVIACNLAGPRRVRAGAARDHFLGFCGINGRGEAWKAGGRVVKNVTGYDMSKLQAGAFGTLSVLLDVTVRVVPRPETSRSIILTGLSDEEAVRALADALNSPHEVSAAAHLPAGIAARSRVPAISQMGGSVTLIRIEGHGPSVDFRADALASRFARSEQLLAPESIGAWREIEAVRALLTSPNALVWRVCPTPSVGPALLRRVRQAIPSAEGFYDWGGGLIWIAIDPAVSGADGGAALVRGALAEAGGGHATLLLAPASIRESVAVFDIPQGAARALTRRVKASFDPHGILNPGRLHEGL